MNNEITREQAQALQEVPVITKKPTKQATPKPPSTTSLPDTVRHAEKPKGR